MARALLNAGFQGTLSAYRFGSNDPTTRVGQRGFVRATLTPDGPGTLVLRWDDDEDGELDARAYGPGADWLLERVGAITGALDPGHEFVEGHAELLRAQHRHPGLRIGASGTLYHELLPVVIAQRITAGEALRQWHTLVHRLGDPAPGPVAGLMTPPPPDRLASQPSWWFHPLGIERRRAEALRTVARHAAALHRWGGMTADEAGPLLRLLPGIGAWTVGSVLGPALGDPDAIAVGDYHLKHHVVFALTGRARGTDDEMLELLAPYAGHRGRAVRLLQLECPAPPAFGPRHRILPMKQW